MHARVVTFRLEGPSYDDYHAHAVEIADSFNEWPGLRAKLWLADAKASRYGGIYLFESAADADRSRTEPQFLSLQSLPVFTELSVEEFDILDAPTAFTGGPFAGAAQGAS